MPPANSPLHVLNAFLEDTCVLVMIAYVLARGQVLTLLFVERANGRRALLLGLLLGIIGSTEILFPGARAPYSVHTLLLTLGMLVGGIQVGLIAALVIVAIQLMLPGGFGALETAIALALGLGICLAVQSLLRNRPILLQGFVAGCAVQLGAEATRYALSASGRSSYAHSAADVLANGIGVLILRLILDEAHTRANSVRHRLEAERAHALISDAQLSALRARVHPHFLFNALTSISALCSLAPDKAENALLRLSHIMRRVLETHPALPLAVAEEIDYVRNYLEIEQLRLGARMEVQWEIDPQALPLPIPGFAIQTLTENAVIHGLGQKIGAGTIHIIVRARPHHTLIAVQDDGVGMDSERRAQALPTPLTHQHGLQIVTQQLILLYGKRARLRLFSRLDAGTLVAFRLPASNDYLPEKTASRASSTAGRGEALAQKE